MTAGPDTAEQRRRWRYGGVIALYVAVWFGWGAAFGPEAPKPIYMYYLLVYVGSVLLHELGHLAAAAMSGMRFREIMLLGVTLSRSEAGWNLKFDEFQHGGHAGAAAVGLHRLRPRLAAFILGGPIADGIAVVVASLLFLVWPFSRILIVWIGVSLLGLYWSFRTNHENDRWHLRQVRDTGSLGNEYLAAYVMDAEGVDEAERERYMADLGYPGALRAHRITKLMNAERYDEVRSALMEVLESGEAAKTEELVWYECNAALYFALRGFDVDRAVAYLPPQTRALAYDQEQTWLYAAFLIAALQSRWEDAGAYAQRGIDHPEMDEGGRRWFEMAKRSADRHLAKSRTKNDQAAPRGTN